MPVSKKPKTKRKTKVKAKVAPKATKPPSPTKLVKKALDEQGYTHAAALSYLTGQSIPTCVKLLSGKIPFQGNGLPRIAKELGIEPEKLR
jgi:hypothetical protein